jgi:hypothetical protein
MSVVRIETLSALVVLLVLALTSCSGPQEALESVIVNLALPDSAISEVEWNELTAYVKENRQQLSNVKVDCFTDSALRKVVFNTLALIHPEVTFNVWKRVPPRIDKVNFYLETSASMIGYFKPISSKFRTDMGMLLTMLDMDYKLSLYTIHDATNPVTHPDAQKFIRDMAQVQIPPGRSSELNEILFTIGDSTKSNEVSFFVSDGIMSLPSDEIKKTDARDANMRLVDEGLKADMIRTFTNLSNKKFGVVMYALKSDFQGSYFTYQNYVHDFSASPVARPYYVWCIGPKEQVRMMNARLVSYKDFDPLQSLELGIFDEVQPDVLILSRLMKEGDWAVDDSDGISDLTWRNPTVLTVGLNLRNLPDYAQQPTYIKQNLQLTDEKGVNLKLRDVLTISEVQKSHWRDLTPREQVTCESDISHFLVLEVDRMTLKSGSSTVELLRSEDDWVKDWSMMDDSSPEMAKKPLTWAFAKFVEGMKDGYKLHNQRHLIFTLSFNQP